jgi:hypothetical protein
MSCPAVPPFEARFGWPGASQNLSLSGKGWPTTVAFGVRPHVRGLISPLQGYPLVLPPLPGLCPGLCYFAPLGLLRFSARKPGRGDISSALGNAQGACDPTIQALKERNNAIHLKRSDTLIYGWGRPRKRMRAMIPFGRPFDDLRN